MSLVFFLYINSTIAKMKILCAHFSQNERLGLNYNIFLQPSRQDLTLVFSLLGKSLKTHQKTITFEDSSSTNRHLFSKTMKSEVVTTISKNIDASQSKYIAKPYLD